MNADEAPESHRPEVTASVRRVGCKRDVGYIFRRMGTGYPPSMREDAKTGTAYFASPRPDFYGKIMLRLPGFPEGFTVPAEWVEP